jgi:hypothetical protein
MSDTKYINDGEYEKRRVYTLKQAAYEMGVTYVSLWRAAARGDLKVLKGFPRLAISAAELERFLSSNTEYSPRRRRGWSHLPSLISYPNSLADEPEKG